MRNEECRENKVKNREIGRRMEGREEGSVSGSWHNIRPPNVSLCRSGQSNFFF